MTNENGTLDCMEGDCTGEVDPDVGIRFSGKTVHACSNPMCRRLYWPGGAAVFRNREPVYRGKWSCMWMKRLVRRCLSRLA